MAKRENAQVVRTNVRELSIGDKTYELEASLGAGIVYSDRFAGELREPYKGLLPDDLMTVWSRSKRTIETKAKVDEDGKPVTDEEGRYVYDPDGIDVEYENPDYRGNDVEAILRIAWAMAVAAGSTRESYEEFREGVIHQPAGAYEEASLFTTVVLVLGGGIIFRTPKGQGGAEQPDEEEAQA